MVEHENLLSLQLQYVDCTTYIVQQFLIFMNCHNYHSTTDINYNQKVNILQIIVKLLHISRNVIISSKVESNHYYPTRKYGLFKFHKMFPDIQQWILVRKYILFTESIVSEIIFGIFLRKLYFPSFESPNLAKKQVFHQYIIQ